MQWKRLQTKGNKPSERTGCGICTIQNNLLVVGGYGKHLQGRLSMGSQFKENSEHDSDHGWSNDVLMFSPLSRSWRPVNTKGSQPPPRAHHTLTTWIEQKVILFGGRSQGSRLNDLYILNMATEEWSEITRSAQSEWPNVRSAHTASSLSSSHLLILGGWDEHDGVISDNYIIDVENASAQKVICVGQATGRANHTVCCQQGLGGAVSVITFGGTETPLCFKKKGLSDVLVYHWGRGLDMC
jgi:N-acetylneuraminic acid mutarotase